MRRGSRFDGDQAEIVFSDVMVEQVDKLKDDEAIDVLAAVIRLCEDPAGKHPLSAPLAGWNTLSTLRGDKRIVYRAVPEPDAGTSGLVEVLCLGPRSDNEVYDTASALVASGLLSEDEATQLWDALAVLSITAEDVGLDGWDYKPPPAPAWLIAAAVQMGVLDQATAAVLSKQEIEAAMAAGHAAGQPDPQAALVAALERARSSVTFTGSITTARSGPRCGKTMRRAGATCIRRRGHPGPCRATP